MAELLAKIQDLKALSPKDHWFCGRKDGEPGYIDTGDVARSRRQDFFDSLMIFSYDGDTTEEPKRTLEVGITSNLTRCEHCIAVYYKGLKGVLDGLREEGYEDDQIETFADMFDNQSVDRIIRGLKRAKATLLALPGDERLPDALSRSDSMAMIEALYCEKFLQNETLLTQHFDEPFFLAQGIKRIATSSVTPALCRFTFSKHNRRRAWAMSTWQLHPSVTDASEFDLSMRPAIAQALAAASVMPVTDLDFATIFWTGMAHLIRELSPERITHSLRNMEIDVCKLVLDYLNLNAPSFYPLLQTITCLLRQAPRDFWDALGAVSPQSVIEGIFHNPRYTADISTDADGELRDPQRLEDLVTWVRPFMESVSSTTQVPSCRSLASQFLDRLQGPEHAESARERWRRAGTNVLKWALLIRLRDAGTSEPVGRAVGSDLLGVISIYIDDILSNIIQRAERNISAELSDLSRELVQAALTLECRLLRIDHQSLSKAQELSASSERRNLEVWKKVVAQIDSRDTALLEAALPATIELSDLGRFGPKAEDKVIEQRKRFNGQFRECIDLMSRVFECVGNLLPRDLQHFVSNNSVRPALTAALLSSEDSLYEATIEIIKSMSGESVRQDAIRVMLKLDLTGALRDFAAAIDHVRESRRFYACPRMLKTSGDIVDILCDPENGLLRGVILDQAAQDQVLQYWKSQWMALSIIYFKTESWSGEQDRQLMKEFCRDTMQFSETLFDSYVVFANAITTNDEGDETSSQRLLLDPLRTLDSMVTWLRLRDDYLAAKAVVIIPQVMKELESSNLEISERVRNSLTGVASGKTRTILTLQQKAEIGKFLDDDEVIITAVVDRGDVHASKSQSTKPSAQTQKYRSGQIDMKAWQANAKTGERSDAEDVKSQPKATQLPVKARALPAGMKRPPRIAPNRDAFLEQRRKELEEKKQRDMALKARRINQDPTSLEGQLAGAGSALAGLGNIGKDRTQKSSNMLISSDEDSDSGGDFDAALFGGPKQPSTSTLKTTEITRRAPVQPRGPVKKTKQERSAKDMRARLKPSLVELHQIILGWDVFKSGDFPPGSARTDYSFVTESFRTPTDYKKTFEPLLLLEAWQGFQQAKEEGWGKALSIKVGTRLTVDALVEVNATLDTAEFKDLGIGESDVLLIAKERTPEASSGRCLARVQKIIKRKPTTVDISFRVAPNMNSILSSLAQGAELFGYKITSLTPLEREYGALSGLQYYDLCEEITRAIPSPLLTYSDEKISKIGRMYDLNKAQARAVQSAVDNDAFTLIQGPPGSGKTKTIISIVGALLTKSLQSTNGVTLSKPALKTTASSGQQSNSAPKKLLVCAPSNAAVDELVMRLMDGVKTYNGQTHEISVIRLGRSDRINPKVAAVTLDELVNRKLELAGPQEQAPDEEAETKIKHKQTCDELARMRVVFDEAKNSGRPVSEDQRLVMDKLHAQKRALSTKIDTLKDSRNTKTRNVDIHRRQVQQELLDSAHVLCATLSGSGHDMFQNISVDFETVIIDEAAQSVELSALIPLKYGCQKCIMVGDPKQLPPTVLSREAARFQYEQSLFVRMQSNRPGDVHLLDTQYRMHPEISQFPSRAFYDGRLLDGDSMASLRQKPWHRDAYLGPYRFFDVQGSHQSGPKGHSLVNMAEVEAAYLLYQRLRRTAKDYDFTGKIGIITPYKSQLHRLRDRFKRDFGEDILNTIEFNTTDAFQGRESEVIIFSCVRASNRGIGFLSDIRRMNVGITRAKCSLWVLGNASSLQQGEYWHKLIADARTRQRYTDGDVPKLIKGPPKAAPNVPQPPTHISTPQDIKREAGIKNEADSGMGTHDSGPPKTAPNMPSQMGQAPTSREVKKEAVVKAEVEFNNQSEYLKDRMDIDEMQDTAKIPDKVERTTPKPIKSEKHAEKRRRSSSGSITGSRSSSKTPRTTETGTEKGQAGEDKLVPLADRIPKDTAAQQGSRAEKPRIIRPPLPPKKKEPSIFLKPKRR